MSWPTARAALRPGLMPIRKILVAVDFSPYSTLALESAKELAQATGASLTLVHVCEITELAIMDFVYIDPPEKIQGAVEAAQKALTELVEAQGGGMQTEVVLGSPAKALADAASDYDLMVVGTHGRTALSRMFVGSVTEQLVRLSPCTVVVAKGDVGEDD